MDNITVSINGSTYIIDNDTSSKLYNYIKRYDSLMKLKENNIRIVTSNGNTHHIKIDPQEKLLKQLSQFPENKYKLIYDGVRIKSSDIFISLDMENTDYIDAIIHYNNL